MKTWAFPCIFTPRNRSRNIKRDGTSISEQNTILALPVIDHDYETESKHECFDLVS